jgi:hypothetical protein
LGFITADIKFIVNDWLIQKKHKNYPADCQFEIEGGEAGKSWFNSSRARKFRIKSRGKILHPCFSYRKTDCDEAWPAE